MNCNPPPPGTAPRLPRRGNLGTPYRLRLPASPASTLAAADGAKPSLECGEPSPPSHVAERRRCRAAVEIWSLPARDGVQCLRLQTSHFRLHTSAFCLPPSYFRLHTSAFILPPSHFRLPPSYFRLLPSAFCLEPASDLHGLDEPGREAYSTSMVKAATNSGLSDRIPLGALRAGRPLGPLTGGLPPPPNRSAVIFPTPYVWHAWRRSRPSRPAKGDDRAQKTIWCPQICGL